MSNLFDQVFDANSPAASGAAIGVELDAYFTDQLGEDYIACGHLAVDAEGRILDVRAYVYGDSPDTLETPFGDGRNAWANVVEWMTALDGAVATLTFARRAHSMAWVAHPLPPDESVFNATRHMAEHVEFEYLGHIITNGSHHGVMLNEYEDGLSSLEARVEDAFRGLPGPVQARIIGAAGDKLMDMMGGEFGPEVGEAIRLAQKHYTEGSEPTQDERDVLNAALRQLEAKLAEQLALVQKPNPMDVPSINKRPDVPGPFYN